ncbi:MAG: hypothetical protein JWM37_674 [Candidatus Saccharibacteria bacterium]|nr:hypothetical protein [Candidatus Saccharibacteria bacterium]
MSDTSYTIFSTTFDKTNHVLQTIEQSYGWPKERREQSYDALRAVLHAMRDRLTVAEAADFAAQLPMLIRGIYYEGWNPSKVPLKMDREEFLRRVQQNFPYEIEGGMDKLVPTVLTALKEFVSEGEFDDIRSILPKDLVGLVP